MDDKAVLQLRAELLGSLLLFTQTFFRITTQKDFRLSEPVSAESHFITVCKALTRVFNGEVNRLMINLPPGWGKSELCKSFIAWALAHYSDAQFLYVSFSHERATEHVSGIKNLIQTPQYRKLFGIELSPEWRAKDMFKTTSGGAVTAFGSKGGITGANAGLPHQPRFSGALLIDDIHKPEEVHSDAIREQVIRNYFETLERRLRSPTVPVIFIGQRLHEDDLPAHLLAGDDGHKWESVIIKALDDHGHPRYPEVNPKEMLLNIQDKKPYVFSSQFQQDPLPPGGGIFKEEWFYLHDQDPQMFGTFLTVDTAETDKTYNDATVFSFWGLYYIKAGNVLTNRVGLHWIDCVELRVEPKDLKDEFLSFWGECNLFPVQPTAVAIEKKSTGVTLSSMLKSMQGMHVIDVERTKASGDKTTRFLEMQEYISNHLISLPRNGKHTEMCITHMRKITANNTHRYDDIADTAYDAVRIAFIDKTGVAFLQRDNRADDVVALMLQKHNHLLALKDKAYGKRL